MDKKILIQYAIWASEMNRMRLSEDMELSHFMLLTEILRREAENEESINVMWLQTELKMSFTKVKAVIKKLELRKFINKTNSKLDKRVKYLQITPSGRSFTYKIISNLNIGPLN